MKFIADFHIHSKYSRATSKDMDIENISKWAGIKGIDLIGTADFTHPAWLEELKGKLVEDGRGLLELRGIKTQSIASLRKPRYILSTEISCIYSQDGKTRKVHSLILAPSFSVVDKINSELIKLGRLDYDGRPIFGISVVHLFELVMEASSDCMLIPCHAWTPHFAVFGSNSGFDSLEAAFGKYASQIYAIETGMSSDPAMNWRLKSLDRITLISNSDAHSPPKLGREATVFDCEMTYKDITEAIKHKDKKKILYTIEFFPEEGKYHYDGHRKCKVCLSPKETKKHALACPVCLKPVTVGVMHRVDYLADREEGVVPKNAIPFKSIVPLPEIISEVLGAGPYSKKVQSAYFKMIKELGPEFKILLDLETQGIASPQNDDPLYVRVAEGIDRMRRGDIFISPGYDGEYGKVKVWPIDAERSRGTRDKQMGLF
ncbi:MAG: endonuclease Q family protein [Candidatus Margulisbacteria bacterium]|nr:endonuclease Q family protein [Candidatus Margulisiibacteriota bacterium]